MKIIQMVPTFSGKDAIGNDVINIHKAITSLGYESVIFTNRMINGAAFPSSTQYRASDVSHDDIVLYHFSIGDEMTDFFAGLDCCKVLVYHNVTPSRFFHPYDPIAERRCRAGFQQVRTLVGKVDHCIADSEWNKKDLESMGFFCPIEVFPILLDFEEYENALDASLLRELDEQPGTKLLSVGRVAPNKCQHDIMKAFSQYKASFDPDAKLYLVGAYDAHDAYYASLVSYALELGIRDVFFTGSLPFEQLVTYYRASDVLLCQSLHEGFCVPLLESMILGLPVIAFDACAVGETLGPGSLLLDTKDPAVVAALIDKVMKDPILYSTIVARQHERARVFDRDVLTERLGELLAKFKGSVE